MRKLLPQLYVGPEYAFGALDFNGTGFVTIEAFLESHVCLKLPISKLEFKDWATLVDQESAQFANAETEPTPEVEAQVATPPPVGGGMRRAPSQSEYEPTPQATRILDDYLMRDDSMLRSLSVRRDPETGRTKFFVPVREMYARMQKKQITNISAKKLVER